MLNNLKIYKYVGGTLFIDKLIKINKIVQIKMIF